jgi:threonine synthase
MDIQIASNFERYLYYLYGKPETVVQKMDELKQYKRIKFTEEEIKKVQAEFASYSTINEETLEIIRDFCEKYDYILDPHTACGVNAVYKLNLKGVNICLSTAHPAKFYDAIYKAIGKYPEEPENIRKIKNLPKRVFEIENNTEKVKEFIKSKLN